MPTLNDHVVTPDLLDTLRSQPDLPEDIWYLVVAASLVLLNRPDEIQTVYNHAIGPGHGAVGLQNGGAALTDDQEQLRIARRLREALLKTSAIGGLPKVSQPASQQTSRAQTRAAACPQSIHPSSLGVSTCRYAQATSPNPPQSTNTRPQTINALQSLNKAVPAHLADAPFGDSPTHRRRDMYDTPTAAVLDRGQVFFDQCYGKVAERVRTSLDQSGTEDLGLAVRLTYGYVLSPTGILSEAETSFVMIAGLIPQDVSSPPSFTLSLTQTKIARRVPGPVKGDREVTLHGESTCST